ncbi:MAG: hypothetical protein Q8K82_10180, partial [Gemmatimonadaceae bacterium]|nr:hypothetical protein [Gemmatimonadaceae bacterium]
MRTVVAAIVSLGAISSAAAQAGSPRAFAPGDWYKLSTLASPAMSPDGQRVAFTVTTVRESENKRHSEVW